MTVEERIAVLEGQLQQVLERLGATTATAQHSDAGLAESLKQHLPTDSEAEVVGRVAYGGALRAKAGELVWDFERDVNAIAMADGEPLAALLAALGHPIRLDIVRLLLRQPRSSQELQALLDIATLGPLYYHLKELMAVGVVTQAARNLYHVAPSRVVPFLVLLSAALDLTGG